MIKKAAYIMITILVLGTMVAAMWSPMMGSDTAIQALTETDDATVMLQTFWPIGLLVIGLGIAAGVIFHALKKFNVM